MPGLHRSIVPPAFEVVSDRAGATAGVAVRGELDLASEDDVSRALDAALRQRPEFLVLDLGAVTFLGSVGVTCLVRAGVRAEALGVRMTTLASGDARFTLDLCDLPPGVRVVDAESAT